MTLKKTSDWQDFALKLMLGMVTLFLGVTANFAMSVYEDVQAIQATRCTNKHCEAISGRLHAIEQTGAKTVDRQLREVRRRLDRIELGGS